MDTYSIEVGADGRYHVRAAGVGYNPGQIVIILPSYNEAEDWVEALQAISIKAASASDVA